MKVADTPFEIGDFARIKISKWYELYGQVVEMDNEAVKFAVLNRAGVRSTYCFRTIKRSSFPYHVKRLDHRPTSKEMGYHTS